MHTDMELRRGLALKIRVQSVLRRFPKTVWSREDNHLGCPRNKIFFPQYYSIEFYCDTGRVAVSTSFVDQRSNKLCKRYLS